MRYVIPNFAKGLVDGGAAAQLSPDYAQKCSELENFYIASDNTLRRRPPLIGRSLEAFTDSVLDFRVNENKLLLLGDTPLNQLENLPESLKRMLWMDSVTGHRLPLSTAFNKVNSIYERTAETRVNIGGTNYDAIINLSASIQKLTTYDRDTSSVISDESYIVATFEHRTEVNYKGSLMSIGAARILDAGAAAQVPSAVDAASLQDPVVVAIYKGSDANAALLAVANTTPYKPTSATTPSIKTENTTDVRLKYFPILVDAPVGLREFITINPDNVGDPIDHLDAHPRGGVSFLFAGLRYRWDGTLTCESAGNLFPDFDELSSDNLKTLISNNAISSEPRLPVKVLYVPASTKTTNDVPFQYKLSVVAGALAEGQQLVTDVANSGLVAQNSLETLLDGGRIRGFTLDAFKELFPILAPITNNLKNVIGYYRDAEDSNGYAYPDLKYLVAGTDVNGAGTRVDLYKQDDKQRAAVVQPSAPRYAIRTFIEEDAGDIKKTRGFMTETTDVSRFPNGNGYAAGGVGVTLALYKDYKKYQPGIANAAFFKDKLQQPDGLLYIFYDYDNEQVQGALDDVPVISGFSASGDHYQSVLLRKAQSAPWRPPTEVTTDFIGTLLRSIQYLLADATDETKVIASTPDTFYNDLGDNDPAITDRRGYVLWPFGPSHKRIKHFATPVYISSLGNTENDFLALAGDLGSNIAAVGSFTGEKTNNQLAGGVEFQTNAALMRYIALPTTYTPAIGNMEVLPGRAVVHNENKLYFSAAGFLNEFSNHVKDYFSAISNVPDSVRVLADSGLRNEVLVRDPQDPQDFEFITPLGEKDNIISVQGPEADSILIGAEHSVKRVSPATLGAFIQFQNISSAGVTSEITHDTSMFIGASGKDLVVARYYRSMQGFMIDMINRETRTLEDADAVVSLIPKHRLLLFSSRSSNVLTCVSVGEDRQFKGIAKFTIPRNVNVTRMKVVDGNTIGFLLSDGSYAEMNFDTTPDTDFTDDISTGQSTYNSVVTTLPLYTMDERRFSPGTSLSVRELFLCMHGYIDAQIGIIDDLTGVVTPFDIRHPEFENATKLRLFSGIFPYKTVPGNGSISPRIRLEKNDNRYLAVSSVVAEVK